MIIKIQDLFKKIGLNDNVEDEDEDEDENEQ